MTTQQYVIWNIGDDIKHGKTYVSPTVVSLILERYFVPFPPKRPLNLRNTKNPSINKPNQENMYMPKISVPNISFKTLSQ